jgi:RNA-binding protein YhbY
VLGLQEKGLVKVKATRKCRRCKENLDLRFFYQSERECIRCMIYRKCKQCGQFKIINEEISYKGFFCFECVKKRRKARFEAKKKKSWERICPDCGTKVVTTVPRATIVYCDKCKEKKKEIKRQAKLRVINEVKCDYCQICKTTHPNVLRKHRAIVCSECRHKMREFKQSCFRDDKYFKICKKCSEEYEVSNGRFWQTLYCKNCTHIEPYKNLKNHKFGYQGFCSDGHKYSSLNEQDLDEWLQARKIRHIAQPRLFPTYRRSDFFLPDFSKHIEMDGLEREDDIDWYGKLAIYKKIGMRLGKDFLILKPVSKHFIEDKLTCFREFDNQVLPLLRTQTVKRTYLL